MRAKTAAVRVGLVALLVLLATTPLVYQYLASMVSLKPSFSKTVTALDFTSAPESASSSDLILAYGILASQLVQEGNYSEAKRLLGMIGRLPANIEHNLGTYITLMNELVLILDSLKSEFDELRDLVSDGAVAQAHEKTQGIEDLIADGSRHLDLLYSSLDRIATIYNIDISTQKHDLEAFSSTLLSFEQLLGNLGTQVEAMDHRTVTQLDLSASPNPVQIEESLRISGQLQSGGIELAGRVVELWINGIETANLTLDHLGMFDWQYHVSSSTRVEKVEVYARYSPVGDDISRLRPARSTTVTVPVKYYSVVLTIAPVSKRILVFENFTVQGSLADSFGRAQPAQTVDLLVDGRQINSSVTDSAGMYSISASLPAGTPEGEHQLYTRFEPEDGIYAPAASDETAIQLYYLRPTISQLALSGVAIIHGEPVAVSGQMAQLEGRLEIDSKPFAQGLVIAFLAGQELGRALSQTNGVFRFPIRIPYDASDQNEIEIVIVPARPWIASGAVSLVLRVLNPVVIGLGIGATVFAVLVFSGRPIHPRSILRRRTASQRGPDTETVVVEKPEVEEETISAPTPSSLNDFKLKLDLELKFQQPRAYVKTVYWETRRMLAEVLGVRGEPSETPREYAARVLNRLGVAGSSLSAITRLFELAEYSQHSISRLEAEEGRNHAFRVAEEVNARMIKH